MDNVYPRVPEGSLLRKLVVAMYVEMEVILDIVPMAFSITKRVTSVSPCSPLNAIIESSCAVQHL